MVIANIGAGDIQRITSGQVITDLISVVKELVENSIDADCRKITIIYSNYGLDKIEVIDDGRGIEPEDVAQVCLKHHTSKLTDFKQLSETGVYTLGFRGEAMSSLCSVAGSVVVTTCTKQQYPRATEIIYDSMGVAKKKKIVVGGLQGTSVKVTNMFDNLPVRRKNLIKNLKREFHKSVNFLINYLLAYPQIRFTIFNSGANGSSNLLMGTKGGPNSTILDSMMSVYGTNGSYGLIPIDIEVENLDMKRLKLYEAGLNDDDTMGDSSGKITLKFTGYVSNCSFGLGRSSADRQFLFINQRPITMKKFTKTINEVYRSYNHIQSPVVVLNIEIDCKYLDVNVTPDKRTVLIHNEDLINEVLRDELVLFYQQQSTVIPKNKNSEITINGERISILGSGEKQAKTEKLYNVRSINQIGEEEDTNHIQEENPEVEEVDADKDETVNVNQADSEVPQEEQAEEQDEEQTEEQEDEQFHSAQAEETPSLFVSIDEDEPLNGDLEDSQDESNTRQALGDTFTNSTKKRPSSTLDLSQFISTSQDTQCECSGDHHHHHSHKEAPEEGNKLRITIGDHTEERTAKKPRIMTSRNDVVFGDDELEDYVIMKKDSSDDVYKLRSELCVDSSIWEQFKSNQSANQTRRGNNNINNKVKVDDITQKEEAEAKLSYTINKQDFQAMKVIGQFNLGFILVTLNQSNNMFIIDQHASDEKYNYERYLKIINFEHNTQSLIIPRTVEMNIIDEMTVGENMSVFRHNGFIVRFDEREPPGSRIKLVSLPVSKHTKFDMSDFHELIHLINERGGNDKQIKCSKWERLLASRACRTSIMIGSSLGHKKMTQVVGNLSTLDKPWNCPHGRPTMRHLIELQQMPQFNADYQL